MTLNADKTWDPAIDPDGAPSSMNSVDGGVQEYREHLGGQLVRVRRAIGGARATLRREADVLDHLQHPALPTVYALHDDVDHTELIISDSGSRTLATLIHSHASAEDHGFVTAQQVIAYLKQAAKTLKHLHTIGWLHGNISPEHLALGEASTIRWTHLDSAISFSPSTQQDVVEEEWATFIEILTQTADKIFFNRRREQRRWETSIELLLNELTSTEDQHLIEQRQTRRPRRHRRMFVVAIALIISGITTAYFVTQRHEDAPSPARNDVVETNATSPTSELPPKLVETLAPTVTHQGTTYQLGQPGDEILIGQWDCTALEPRNETALVARSETGEIFWFPSWANSNSPVSSVPVGFFPKEAVLEAHAVGHCDVLHANGVQVDLQLPLDP